MSAQILDGKQVSLKVRDRIAEETAELKAKFGKAPGLSVVLVGEDPASRVYVRNKNKTCREIGFESFEHYLPADTPEDDVYSLVNQLNNDKAVNGILVQLPLPPHINSERILEAVDPAKDVDGFHPANVGRLVGNRPGLVPCTPAGIIHILDEYKIGIEGKHAVVLGRSNIVGKPVAFLLLHRNATVTICHSRTQNLPRVAASADLLVAAIGKPGFVNGDMVKKGAVVVDVGINRVDGKLTGDVVFDEAAKNASFITPVPGGVGPMTIAMLMSNTLKAFMDQNKIS